MKEKSKCAGKISASKMGRITLYVCGGFSLVVGMFMIYYSIIYLRDYYGSYGMSMSDGILDVIQYVVTSSGIYFGFAVLFMACGVLLNKLDLLAPKSEAREIETTETPQVSDKEEAGEEKADEEKAGEELEN